MPMQEVSFSCHRCGLQSDEPTGFYRSNSMIYGKNGYMPICKDCLALLYDRYLRMYESAYLAIKRLCMIYDLYYSDSIVDACYKNKATFPIGDYMKKLNLSSYKGKTFENSLREGFFFDMKEPSTVPSDQKADPVSAIPESVRSRWGAGFSDEEYKALEEHYRYIKKANPDCDSNQEIFIMDLCQTKMQQISAMKSGRTDDYIKLTESYRKTFAQAGLKTTTESIEGADDRWGDYTRMVSQYTPEEYYKDKKLYKDFDGLGEYFKRMLLRPLRNLKFGTTDRDEEFFVDDE